MKIAALYARVSTERQEKEETIGSQIAEVEERIKKDGNVLGENFKFIDEGWSGDLLGRPALDLMRDAIKKKEFTVLYLYDLGRLSRNFVNQLILTEELQKEEIEIISLHDINGQSDEAVFAQRVLSLSYDLERKKIAEKMRRGKLFKAKNGKIVHGPGSYGYNYILKKDGHDGYLEINDDEAEVVRKIFRWVADERLTIRRVIKRLYDLKILPRKKKRNSWTNGPLCRMLRNECYIGRAYYNKNEAVEPKNPVNFDKYKKNKKSSRRLRPKEEWIPIPVPAILDEDLFYRAQRQLEINAEFSMRNKKHDYLLTGFIYCDCESRMCGEGAGGQYYYRCSDRVLKYPSEKGCRAGGLNTARIDNVVWKKIKELLTNPQLLRGQAERWLGKLNKQSGEEQEMESINKLLDKLNQEEKRLVEAYSKNVISFTMLKEREDDIKAKRNSYEIQIEKLKTDREVSEVPNLSVEDVCKRAIKSLADYSESEIRDILMRLKAKIIVNRERSYATIKGCVPIYLEKEDRNYGLRIECRYSWVTQRGEVHAF